MFVSPVARIKSLKTPYLLGNRVLVNYHIIYVHAIDIFLIIRAFTFSTIAFLFLFDLK